MAEHNSRRGQKEALFGTDGIRGIAGEFPITTNIAYCLGRAVSAFFKNLENTKIITGRDTRESGRELERYILSGIKDSQLRPISASIIPTPGLAYIVRSTNALSGVMVSASHNPSNYNGFKVFNGYGYKLSEEDEKEIENLIYSMNSKQPESSLTSDAIKYENNDLINTYASFLSDSLIDGISIKEIKVIIDCGNGATYQVAPLVFDEYLGLNAQFININPDGRNINQNCGSQFLDPLKEEVIRKGADLGIAFDGDGDRLIAVTDKGSVLTGDHIIAICSRMFKEMNLLSSNTIVSTIMSNMGLTISLRKMGLSHIRTDVGDRNVCEAMKEKGAIIGGEESGHIIFLNRHTTGDGILSAIYLLCAMSYFGRSSSELSEFITIYPQKKINIRVKRKPPFSTIPELSSKIREIESLLGDRGRVVVRYSGTEPVCRVMIEGEEEEKIESYALSIAQLIEKLLN